MCGAASGRFGQIFCRSFRAGPHTNIQDPGLRFASPWALVYDAFGVKPRSGKSLVRFDERDLETGLRLFLHELPPEMP